MLPVTSTADDERPNHPLAVRMGIIAGVSQNLIIGTEMGSFGVLLASIQQRLGVSPEQAALGIPMLILGSALSAPFVGVLAAKYPLRFLLLAAAVMVSGGFILLGLTTSYPIYLAVYMLLFGPAMSLGASVGPATLVTRWFSRNRGLALGVVNLPIVIAAMPLLSNWFVERSGAVATYLTIGIITGVILIPLSLLTIDHPPTGETLPPPSEGRPRTADGSLSLGQLLSNSRFWALSLAGIASMSSSVALGSLLVPIGVSWHFTRWQSALLATIMSLVGLAGSILYGWIADKIGGAKAVALICLSCTVLWLLLLLAPPYFVVAVIIGFIGMAGAGAVPALSRGYSEIFGQASFSRAFGLNTIVGLPFVALSVAGSARVYSATGSYNAAMVAISVFFAIGTVLALYASRGPTAHTRAVINPA